MKRRELLPVLKAGRETNEEDEEKEESQKVGSTTSFVGSYIIHTVQFLYLKTFEIEKFRKDNSSIRKVRSISFLHAEKRE